MKRHQRVTLAQEIERFEIKEFERPRVERARRLRCGSILVFTCFYFFSCHCIFHRVRTPGGACVE